VELLVTDFTSQVQNLFIHFGATSKKEKTFIAEGLSQKLVGSGGQLRHTVIHRIGFSFSQVSIRHS
jgi:hypothetical protein